MDPTEEGEENTITVQVSAEMTREDVVHTVLKAVGGGAGDKVNSYMDSVQYNVSGSSRMFAKRSRRRRRRHVVLFEQHIKRAFQRQIKIYFQPS